MCGGHTHLQQIHQLGDTLFFNPGSVGFAYSHQQPEDHFKASPWAEYAVLTYEDGRDRAGIATRALQCRGDHPDLPGQRAAVCGRGGGAISASGWLMTMMPSTRMCHPEPQRRISHARAVGM